MSQSDSASSRAVRARLDHPVIDADGHIIEFLPAVRDFLVEEGGRKLAEEFDAVVEAGHGSSRFRSTSSARWGSSS